MPLKERNPPAVQSAEERESRMQIRWLGTTVLALSALVAFAGCSAGNGEEKTGAAPQGLTDTCLLSYTGQSVPWLVDDQCGCESQGYANAQLTMCVYQSRLLECLGQVGMPQDCRALPPLPRAFALDQRTWTVLDTSQ